MGAAKGEQDHSLEQRSLTGGIGAPDKLRPRTQIEVQ
jgi:hypothetical protein